MRTFEEVVATSTRTSGLLSWLSVLFGVLAAAARHSRHLQRDVVHRRATRARAGDPRRRRREPIVVAVDGVARRIGAERRGNRGRRGDRVRRVGRVAQLALRRQRHRSDGVRRLRDRPGRHRAGRLSDPGRARCASRTGDGAQERIIVR